MLRSKIVVAVVTAALAFSPVSVSAGGTPPPVSHSAGGSSNALAVWLIFGCASGIILAAAIANARQNRQLTQREAISCGLLYLLNQSR